MTTREELKEQQRRQWGGNAANWDRQHDRLERDTRPVTDWLCKSAGLAPGMRVLDLACGSGHAALEEGRLVQPGGSVVATDLAPEMVETTLRRAGEAGLDNLTARVVDAESIDYPDESDAVTMRFGLMFCPEPERAVAEIRRVLRPRGRFAVAVWDDPRKSPAHSVLDQAMERAGLPDSEQQNRLGPLRLSSPGALESVLRSGGLTDFETESLSMAWEYGSFEEFWLERVTRSPQVGRLLAEDNQEAIERFKSALSEVVQPYAAQGRLRLTATALCAAGQK